MNMLGNLVAVVVFVMGAAALVLRAIAEWRRWLGLTYLAAALLLIWSAFAVWFSR